jgi:CDP-4-dehydro-6-deoxyglucose reductase
MSVRVSLANSGRDFSAPRDATLLEAALAAGLNLPHSCKTGHCLACRARLIEGEIDYPGGEPLALGDAERAEGLILLCLAHARSDLTVELIAPTLAGERRIRRLPCRIERAVALAHDVRALYLKLPAAAPLDFEAGQYVDILLPGSRRRSFSIASPPHQRRLLEVHVRRVPGGEISEALFEPHIEGRLLTIEGPLGHFYYREGSAQVPMLLIGGGTGLAPLLCIVRHLRDSGRERRIVLYWGVRSERDLYAQRELLDWARDTSSAVTLDYRAVLSEPSPAWTGRRGLVHAQVLEEVPQLGPYEVYASGPPAMIAAIRTEFAPRGLDPARLYFDSFDFAPDSPARQRVSASTSE